MINKLAIVEGKETEHDIIESILLKFNFRNMNLPIEVEKTDYNLRCFESKTYDARYFVVTGPNPQVISTLRAFDSLSEDLSFEFGLERFIIESTFIVYDLDFANPNILDILFQKNYSTPQDGYLLINSPCVEVVFDEVRNSYVGVPREYKKVVRSQIKATYDFTITIDEYLLLNVLKFLLNNLKTNINSYGDLPYFDQVELFMKDLKNNKLDFKVYSNSCYTVLGSFIYVILIDLFKIDRKPDMNKSLENLLVKHISLCS
jgi:hypothetical protein